MGETFVISDTHFDHINVIKYNSRPFNNINEMNEALIENWNNVVTKNDRVIIVGDFAFKRHQYFLNRLNGFKDLIVGSHDKVKGIPLKALYSNVYTIGTYNLNDMYIVCSHCCMRVWERSHYGSIHLFGHSHGNLKTYNMSFDVGVDVPENNYTPIHIDEIKRRAEKRKEEMLNSGRIITRNSKTLFIQDDVAFMSGQIDTHRFKNN